MARSARHRVREAARSLSWRARGWPTIQSLRRRGLRAGSNVFLAGGAHIDPDFLHLIEVRDDVTIAANVTILAHDAAGRHVVGYGRVAPVLLDEGAFIGANATILPGVTVGARSIVAAGSVVVHDVAPETIVGGNPARRIGDRSAYAARRQARRLDLPHWERDGWTVTTGITEERMDEMRRALAETGEGFIT